MSNYTKSTNFATKDNLTPGDPLKVVRGTEIDTEYNNIATAVATKTDNASAAITGGAIDGATVGATTPATGSFTTLAASGTTTLAGALVGAVTQAAFNTVSTTLNLGGAATAVNLGAATGTATVNNTTLAAKAITASTTLAVTGTSTLTGAVTATAGVSGPITSSSVSITGGSITGITDLAVADGGTGASTAAGGLNNLLPSQTGNANKYLQSDGTNASWDAVSLSTADITGTLGVANGGTGVTTSTGTTNVVLSNSPTLVTPALGTPASGVATNLTGLPISTGVSGLGTGVATFLGTPSSANLASAVTDETGSGALVFANSPTLVTPALGTPASGVLTNATGLPISTGVSGLGTGVATFLATPSSANLASAVSDETGSGALVFANSPTLVTPALGTPSALVGTNITGTASGLTAGNVTTNANLTGGVTSVGNAATVVTNANLTGAVTSVGNATSLGSFTSAQLLGALTDETGTGSAVFATSPTLVTPALGTPSALVGTNITGTASGLTAGNVTTNANLTGAITSTGNATSLGSFSSANLLGALTDETGTGSAVFATSPTLVTPILGVATATSLQGIIGNVTPAAGSFTTLGASSTATLNTLVSSGATLTGGTINGMTVGATTASTGAFTTLSATGVTTLQAGTNLLPALTTTGDTNTGIFFPAADKLGFTAGGGTDQLVLTSTGLGIGTSLPSQKLVVIGEIALGNTVGGQSARIAVADGTSGPTDARFLFRNGTDTDAALRLIINSATNISLDAVRANNSAIINNIVLQPNGGAVGIGVSLPVTALDVNGSISLRGTTLNRNIAIINNAGTFSIAQRTDISATVIATSATPIIVEANGAERARISSDGTFRVKGAGVAGSTDAFQVAGGAPASAVAVTSGGNLSIANGNLVIGTAGKGIDFSADPSAAGMTSELLDDYEEGTWTPNLTFATPGTRTLAEQVGFYTKVGNVVHVSGAVSVVKGTGSGAATITGLPFQTNSNVDYIVPVTIVANTAGSANNTVAAFILPATQIISLLLSPESIAGLATLTAAEMAASATFRFTVSYQI